MRLPTRLLRRKVNTHKGNFGHILILSGSSKFSGAALLTASAAIRSGAGLVTLGIPKGLNQAIIKVKPAEIITLPLPETKEGTLSLSGYKKIKSIIDHYSILVVGPGLTQNKSTQALVRKVINGINLPLVIDADGINALAGHLDKIKKLKTRNRKLIITPHPGEMARLLAVSSEKIQNNRKDIARRFARDYKLTLVLKGHRSIVADHSGRTYINQTGNPGMATAGSGDVLTGIIASFLGQGLEAFEAAKYATYLHGAAGDLAAKKKTQIAMIASDIIQMIPEAIKKASFCRRSSVGRAADL